VAISPQLPAQNAEVQRNNKLEYPVLSDANNAYATRLSLAFAVPDDLREVYRSFGIELPEFNGDDSWSLPMPARIVADRHGVIRSIDADPDYTLRPEPGDTSRVLESL
jgi:peroxiredoxin